jgi:cytoskeleton protein RodZ
MSKTVGQQLRQARETRSLSLEQAAQATRIRAHYLQSLEAGEFEALPSSTQARGFLRTYASYLKLDAESLLAQMDKRAQAGTGSPAADTPRPGTPPARETAPPAPAAPARSERPTTPVIAPVLEPADAIFMEVGLRLKRQRELLGLSLEDVERHTHLRRHYLEALESGNLHELPSPVQGRGMLNNYAVFLGMDPEPVLLRFADGLQARLATRQGVRPDVQARPEPQEVRPPGIFRRLFSGDFLIGGTLAVFLVIFVLWGAIRIFSTRSEGLAEAATPTVTAPSIADVLLATSTPSPSPVAQTVPATPVPSGLQVTAVNSSEGLQPPQAQAGKVQIYIIARQRAWMQALVDGEVEFDGRVIPGRPYTFVGDQQVEIVTGNGAALQVYYDQVDLGLLGTFGQIVDRIFTLQGITTPTATVTPLPSATPLVSPTAPLQVEPGQPTLPAIP